MTRKIYVWICLVVLTISGAFYITSSASGGEAGTIDDPLVTKSYMDAQIAKVMAEVKKQGSTNPTNTNTNVDMAKVYEDIDRYIATHYGDVQNPGETTSQGAKYVVVEAKAGSKIICDESAEVILRAGEAKIISNEAGNGLADVTLGIDLSMGVIVPKNHLLIVPRTDGRGLEITKHAFVMVKGSYTVVEPAENEAATDKE